MFSSRSACRKIGEFWNRNPTKNFVLKAKITDIPSTAILTNIYLKFARCCLLKAATEIGKFSNELINCRATSKSRSARNITKVKLIPNYPAYHNPYLNYLFFSSFTLGVVLNRYSAGGEGNPLKPVSSIVDKSFLLRPRPDPVGSRSRHYRR